MASSANTGTSIRGIDTRSLAVWSLFVVLSGVLIAGFAPVAMGGRTAFVVTEGTSMLPDYLGDGLVVTRKQADYHVGDVVAYRNADLSSVVMHRIVALDGEHFTFKGDNNSVPDLYRPTEAELVGEEVIYWPGAGRYLRLLRSPLAFGLILGLGGLVSLSAPRTIRRRRRHHGQ